MDAEFNESQVSSREKFERCVRFIEENPVRARLVSRAGEYHFSSASSERLDPSRGTFGIDLVFSTERAGAFMPRKVMLQGEPSGAAFYGYGGKARG